MTQEPRRPIFWFLWPRPDPHRPLDGDVVQTRWVRVTRQGPWRLAFLIPFTLLVVVTALLGVFASVFQPDTGSRVFAALLTASIAVAVIWLVMRAWVVGTYVNDAGVRITRTFTAVLVPWEHVLEIYRGPGRARFLGLPFHVQAVRVDLVLDDGEVVRTDLTSVSPDLWGRPEAFDMASSRLRRWRQEIQGDTGGTR